MKKYNYLVIMLCIINITFGQSIGVNTDNIKFSNDLQFFKPIYVGDIELKSLGDAWAPRFYFSKDNGAYYGYIGRPTLNATNTFEIGSYESFAIRTSLNGWFSRLFIKETGEVGIGTENPTSKLEVNGFTKLGTDAPAIKLKKLTSGCTTSANSGFPSGEISLTHGITPSKILKVEALVEYTTNFWVKDGNDLFGYEFDVYVTNTTISLRNLSGSASSEIRSKPYKILITYEE